MISQDHVTPGTPMGVELVASGATVRVWAPRASAVHLCGSFRGGSWTPSESNRLARFDGGHWTGFVEGARPGDEYKFHVVGAGSSGFKRDPYARELSRDPPFPHSSCVITDRASYRWRVPRFDPAPARDLVMYQAHVGAFGTAGDGRTGTFLDVAARAGHLARLGINMLQLLPIDEVETTFSMGYNGSDYFSPDMPYTVADAGGVRARLPAINALLAARGLEPVVDPAELMPAPNQVKVMVDVLHACGIAVALDVVYNHAGGFDGDDEALYFWDRYVAGDNNDSLYFTDRGWAGGLSFALWNRDVRQFLIDSARYYVEEFRVDGFRYDEVSALLAMNGESGWSFCRDLTSTLRYVNPRFLQNAEHWPPLAAIVTDIAHGGAGFDVVQHDGLRRAIRAAVGQSAAGRGAFVDMQSIADNIFPYALGAAAQAVTCIENHDLVKRGNEDRIPRIADGSDPRSWCARSRTRVANALLLSMPGIPMLFMGQEFLEDKQWSDDPGSPLQLSWAGLETDGAMRDQLHMVADLVALRRSLPALAADAPARAYHVHSDNRVIAIHRWVEGVGADAIVVASLNESPFWRYEIGFPSAGDWRELFDTDVYDGWVNPNRVGNAGSVRADGPPRHGFAASAAIVIPANGVVVFARA